MKIYPGPTIRAMREANKLFSELLQAEADSPIYACTILARRFEKKDARIRQLEKQLKQCLKYGTNLPPQVRADALNVLHSA